MSKTSSSRPPLARLKFIHNHILAGRRVNATALEEAFGVKRWTVIRDADFMRIDQMAFRATRRAATAFGRRYAVDSIAADWAAHHRRSSHVS